MNFKSIKSKMIFTIGLVILFIVAGSAWLAYNQSHYILKQTLLSAAGNSVKQNAEIFDKTLKSITNQIKNLDQAWFEAKSGLMDVINTSIVKDMYWSEHKDAFIKLVEEQEYLKELFIVDMNGDYLMTSGKTGNMAEADYLQLALNVGEMVISRPIQIDGTENKVIVIVLPVNVEEKTRAVLGGLVDYQLLQEMVVNMNINGFGNGWIIDSNMYTIFHPDTTYISNTKFIDEANQELKDLVSKMMKGEAGVDFFTMNGVENEIAYAPINQTGWFLAITAESSDLLAPLKNMGRTSLIIGLIAVLLGLIIIYFVSIRIASPIVKLSLVTGKIADGDLTQDITNFKYNNKDEIGKLIQSTDKMLVSLRDIIKHVIDIITHLTSSSKELAETSEQVKDISGQVGNAIQEVASGAEKQSEQIEKTNYTIKNLLEQINQIQKMSKEMEKTANGVMGSISDGKNHISNSINQVNKVKEESQTVSGQINSLGKSSEKISEILKLINGIAAQTNLLALNAAIEAARAGEAGRGFSVVADEIRELAEESSKATEQISTLIGDIREGVNTTVERMQNSSAVVSESVNTIEKTGQSFNEISDSAASLTELIEEINQKAQDMTINSTQVEMVVNEVASVSQQTAANTEEVAASSQEQNAAVEEIADFVKRLANITSELSETIHKFKI